MPEFGIATYYFKSKLEWQPVLNKQKLSENFNLSETIIDWNKLAFWL